MGLALQLLYHSGHSVQDGGCHANQAGDRFFNPEALFMPQACLSWLLDCLTGAVVGKHRLDHIAHCRSQLCFGHMPSPEAVLGQLQASRRFQRKREALVRCMVLFNT